MVTQELHAREKAPKKLYRSERNIVIAGVTGGLGDYFNADPNAFRVLFAVLTLVFGLGAIIYLILWILLPPASQTGQDEIEIIINNLNVIKSKLSSATAKNEIKRINEGNGPDKYDRLRLFFSVTIMVTGVLAIVFSFAFFTSILGFKAVFVFLLLAVVFAIAVVLIK
jgi:phage shock protein C